MKLSLKAARINAGYTVTEAARQLGVSRETIYNHESGKSTPLVTMGLRIAELYGLTVDQIDFSVSDSSTETE